MTAASMGSNMISMPSGGDINMVRGDINSVCGEVNTVRGEINLLKWMNGITWALCFGIIFKLFLR
jgi:hypothetical protein